MTAFLPARYLSLRQTGAAHFKGPLNHSFPYQTWTGTTSTACEPACPWEAIFPEDDVPDELQDDIKLNYDMEDVEDDFEVQEEEEHAQPSPEQVAANKAKWGLPA